MNGARCSTPAAKVLAALLLLGSVPFAATHPLAAQRSGGGPGGLRSFVASPDGRVELLFGLDSRGEAVYAVTLGGHLALAPSPLGLVTSHGVWETGLTEVGRSEIEPVADRYRLLHGKCSDCSYEARRRVVRLADSEGRALEIVFQVSDDGVALRYRIPGSEADGTVTARRELTGFGFPAGTTTWLMPMDSPESGWMRVNPAYESHYVQNGLLAAPSPTGVGWAFPGLFRIPGAGWALVTEAGMDGSYCGSRLRAQPEGVYRIAFPEAGEGTGPDDPIDPSFGLPFASPWRLVILGTDLGPIVESTLVTDVSSPSTLSEDAFVRPGKAAWSWLPLKDESIVPEVQRDFVDMAEEEGYEYVLVDNWWDRNLGYDGLEELVGYASVRGVGVLAWYNSNGSYNDAPRPRATGWPTLR